MKPVHLGLLLSLVSSVALAQNSSTSPATPPGQQPATSPATPPGQQPATSPAPPPAANPQGSNAAQTQGGAAVEAEPQGAGSASGDQQAPASGPTEPQQAQMNAQPHFGAGPSDPFEGEIIETPNGTYMVEPSQGNGGPMPSDAEGNDEMQPQMPVGAAPHLRPAHPVQRVAKAAHFHIKGPDLALDVKCPEDEPVKSCVDAATQLIDKAVAIHH